MTTRHNYRRASHKSLGALLFTSILVACANGGALDDTSGDSTGTDRDSGAVLSDDGGDEGSAQIQSDGGRPTNSDSGGTLTQDSGGNPQPDAAPGQDAAPPPPPPPPQDAAPPPVDAAPPPQDAAPPPPPDSGPLCNHPSGSTCGVDPQCGCASGQSCDMTTPTSTSCVGSGSGGQYANCSTTSDCQAGYTCANDSLGSFCGRWCIVGGAGQCPSGLTCTGFSQKHTYNGTEYGVCY